MILACRVRQPQFLVVYKNIKLYSWTMKQNKPEIWSGHFLDVTEYILTGPNLPKLKIREEESQPQPIESATPANCPVTIEVDSVQLSPYFKQFFSSSHEATIEFLEFSLERAGDRPSRKYKHYTIDGINEEEDYFQQSDDQDREQHDYESDDQEQPSPESSESADQPIDDIPIVPHGKLNLAYFRKHLQHLKSEKAEPQAIKSLIMEYLTQEDKIEKHEALSAQSNQDLISLVEFNLRQVGPISWLQRKYKVQKYLHKKKRRSWRKIVSYDCRKRVADSRLRVKGKFVTKEQACAMLGVEDCPQQELKGLLEAKFGKASDS